MNPIVVTVGPLAAASANNIAHTQTPTKGPLTLNGALVVSGVVVMDSPRQVLLTTTADETAHTFTFTGTDPNGSAVSEVVTGVNNSTVATVLSYATISSIAISANAAGALTVGTNGVGTSAWVRLDGWADPTVGKQCTVSGTANYTVQFTFDDPNSPTNAVNPNALTWVNDPDLQFVNATATAQGWIPFPPIFLRCVLNSGTGSVKMTVQQSSNATY